MSTTPVRRKITLFGLFGQGNLGNECTLEAMLHNIRKWVPDAEISCLCTGPQEVASQYHIPAFAIKEMPLPPVKSRVWRLLRRAVVSIPLELLRWFKAAKRLKGCHMFIIAGTGIVSDIAVGPGGHYEMLRYSLLAKLRRCRVFFVSVGAGPIHGSLSKFFIKARRF